MLVPVPVQAPPEDLARWGGADFFVGPRSASVKQRRASTLRTVTREVPGIWPWQRTNRGGRCHFLAWVLFFRSVSLLPKSGLDLNFWALSI